MTLTDFLRDVRADRAAYAFAPFLLQPGWWVVFSYRLRRFRKFGPLLARLLLPLDFLVGSFRRQVSDTRIAAKTAIGPGLCLVHARGIRISPMAVIGANVRIFHQVTIGEGPNGAPTIGDECILFGGSRVAGGVTIGARTRIGQNCVVMESLPPRVTVEVARFMVTRGMTA